MAYVVNQQKDDISLSELSSNQAEYSKAWL